MSALRVRSRATALAGIGSDASGFINARISTGTQVGLFQMWNVHSFDADPLVYIGFARGDLDLDGDGSKDAFSAAFRFTAVTAFDASQP